MVREKTFVKGGEFSVLALCEFDEPSVGDLAASLDGVWRQFLIAKVVVPELMLGMGKDAFESSPGRGGGGLAGELHLETEKGPLSDWTSGKGWLCFREPDISPLVVNVGVENESEKNVGVEKKGHGFPERKSATSEEVTGCLPDTTLHPERVFSLGADD